VHDKRIRLLTAAAASPVATRVPTEGRRYLGLNVLARSQITPTTTDNTDPAETNHTATHA
jgi:hypothetical protein